MADTQGDGDGRHVAFANRARPLKWIAMKALGSYVARTWRGDIVARPMNADGSMSTSVDEETSVETNDEHYAQIRAFIVAETGEFQSPPAVPKWVTTALPGTWFVFRESFDLYTVNVFAIWSQSVESAREEYNQTCRVSQDTVITVMSAFPGKMDVVARGTPLKTVGDIRRALAPFSDDQIAVMDVNLEQCHSDRNVMHVAGIRPDVVVDGALPWVFMDAGEHAAP